MYVCLAYIPSSEVTVERAYSLIVALLTNGVLQIPFLNEATSVCFCRASIERRAITSPLPLPAPFFLAGNETDNEADDDENDHDVTSDHRIA